MRWTKKQLHCWVKCVEIWVISLKSWRTAKRNCERWTESTWWLLSSNTLSSFIRPINSTEIWRDSREKEQSGLGEINRGRKKWKRGSLWIINKRRMKKRRKKRWWSQRITQMRRTRMKQWYREEELESEGENFGEEEEASRFSLRDRRWVRINE